MMKKGGLSRHKKVVKRDAEVSSSPGIIRLTKQGESIKVSKIVVAELKNIMKNMLARRIVNGAVTYMEHSRRKTINLKDVVHAYEFEFGMKYYGTHPPSKVCAKAPKTAKGKSKSLHAQVAHYQKQSDCLLLQKAPFRECMKELIIEYSSQSDVRIKKDAMLALQDIIERFTVKIIKNGVEIMVTCGGTMLMLKHLQAALRVMGLRE